MESGRQGPGVVVGLWVLALFMAEIRTLEGSVCPRLNLSSFPSLIHQCSGAVFDSLLVKAITMIQFRMLKIFVGPTRHFACSSRLLCSASLSVNQLMIRHSFHAWGKYCPCLPHSFFSSGLSTAACLVSFRAISHFSCWLWDLLGPLILLLSSLGARASSCHKAPDGFLVDQSLRLQNCST